MTSYEQAMKGFRQFVEQKMKDWKVPGAAIAVVKDDKVVFSEGFGYRNIEKSLKVTPETVFAIGSATKPFTTASMGLLVNEGRLDWDSPVKNYLPTFKLYDSVATEQSTPRDLASHRTGLSRHDLMWYSSPFTRTEIIDRLQYLEPNQGFRSVWQYQNLMYMVAGFMVGKIAGMSWEAFVRERLFYPLKMENSSFSVDEVQKGLNYATPYKEHESNLRSVPFRNIDEIGPAGSINSTVVDMVKWISLHLNKGKVAGKPILKEETVSTLHTSHSVCAGLLPSREMPLCNYGLGWFIEPYRGYEMLHHGGNIDGFSAHTTFMPYEKIGIVILTNKDRSLLPIELAYNIYDRMLGLNEIEWSDRIKNVLKDMKKALQKTSPEVKKINGTNPSRSLHEYTGTYRHPGYGDLIIESENNELYAHFRSEVIVLSHYHYDTFKFHFEPFGLNLLTTFIANIDGHISRYSIPLQVEEGTKPVEFIKIKET